MATDYYEILGVQPDADFEIIKQRYRLLVRENHPDVAIDKEAAHARMQLILEAWNVLANPEERARYDRKRNPPPTSHKPDKPTRNDTWASPVASSAENLRTQRQRNFEANRAGRAGIRAQTNSRTRALHMVFEAANLYFEGHVAEAVAACTKVMKMDPTNAEAPALLGDIYAEQGRKDVALVMYERAMRLQPNNLLYRQKWRSAQEGGTSGNHNAASTAPSASPSASATATPPVTTSPTVRTTATTTATTTAPAANAANGAAPSSQSANSNGSSGAHTQSTAQPTTSPAAPANNAATSERPANSPDADASRPSIVRKLTGWIGKKP